MPLQLLQEEMSKFNVSSSTMRAMSELCYTASETGLIPFAFQDNEDLIAMIQLVHLSEKYADDGVPSTLRM